MESVPDTKTDTKSDKRRNNDTRDDADYQSSLISVLFVFYFLHQIVNKRKTGYHSCHTSTAYFQSFPLIDKLGVRFWSLTIVNLKNRTHFKYSSAIITELWAAPLSFNNACISVSSGVILESILETTLTHELIQGTEDELDPISFVDCSIYFSFLRILHPFVWNPS